MIRAMYILLPAAVALTAPALGQGTAQQPGPLKPAPVSVGEFLDAALNGDGVTVTAALTSGINANVTGEDGHTALMLAGFNGHTEILIRLLEAGAKVDRRDASGRTALMYTATGPHPQAVQLLLDRGAEIDAVDTAEHWSPLMWAAAEGHRDVVRLLLSKGADPTLQDVDGETAAIFAANNGHAEVAALLTAAPDPKPKPVP